MTDDVDALAQHILNAVKGCKPMVRDEVLAKVVATCMKDHDKPGLALGIFLERVRAILGQDGH